MSTLWGRGTGWEGGARLWGSPGSGHPVLADLDAQLLHRILHSQHGLWGPPLLLASTGSFCLREPHLSAKDSHKRGPPYAPTTGLTKHGWAEVPWNDSLLEGRPGPHVRNDFCSSGNLKNKCQIVFLENQLKPNSKKGSSG